MCVATAFLFSCVTHCVVYTKIKVLLLLTLSTRIMYDSGCACLVVSVDDQLKPSIDAVAIERDTMLRQVALCCLLNTVDLPILDGIANHNDSEHIGWPSNSCCNGLKLTYENPLFASVRLLFHLFYYLVCIVNILMMFYIFLFNYSAKASGVM